MNRFDRLKDRVDQTFQTVTVWADASDRSFSFTLHNKHITVEIRKRPGDREVLFITDDNPMTFEDEVDTTALDVVAFLLNEEDITSSYKVNEDTALQMIYGKRASFEVALESPPAGGISPVVAEHLKHINADFGVTISNLQQSDDPQILEVAVMLAAARASLVSARNLAAS